MNYTQTPQAATPELSDIQGLIINGYTHPCSVHMLFKFHKNCGLKITIRLPSFSQMGKVQTLIEN